MNADGKNQQRRKATKENKMNDQQIHPELINWIQRTIENEKREKVAVDFKIQLDDGQWVWIRRHRLSN